MLIKRRDKRKCPRATKEMMGIRGYMFTVALLDEAFGLLVTQVETFGLFCRQASGAKANGSSDCLHRGSKLCPSTNGATVVLVDQLLIEQKAKKCNEWPPLPCLT